MHFIRTSRSHLNLNFFLRFLAGTANVWAPTDKISVNSSACNWTSSGTGFLSQRPSRLVQVFYQDFQEIISGLRIGKWAALDLTRRTSRERRAKFDSCDSWSRLEVPSQKLLVRTSQNFAEEIPATVLHYLFCSIQITPRTVQLQNVHICETFASSSWRSFNCTPSCDGCPAFLFLFTHKGVLIRNCSDSELLI